MTDQLDGLKTALSDRYTIERELGAGGMATVYLAHDIKHNRKVAVKVLRPELAAILGAERFLKEIEVTANLQHPHILPLFDSGEAGDELGRGMPRPFLYYVMPYVEGESLRDKLNREKQLAVDEAVRIARAVADALQYAHERSVIHRDIKPENILLHSGNAMVADFGIALAVQQAGGNRLTETGLSLGTPQYMSPEQATADREIDARSDVYSLGAVLYEMLAGDPPHTGSSAQAIIASVVTKEPEAVTERRPTAPQHVVDTVHIAIQKLPADRFATAGDMVTALDGNILSQYTAPRKAVSGAQAPARRLLWPVLAVLFAALALYGWLRPRQDGQNDPVRLSISLPSDARLAQEVDGYRLAISPDGQRVVYVGEGPSGRQLYVRDLGTIEVRPLPGTEGAYNPFFSPDGEWIAFAAAERIAKVATDGGPVSTVMSWPGGGQMYGGTWLENDTLVITQEIGQTLLKVAANGGEPLVMETADTLFWHWWPQVLPDNQHILVSLWPRTGSLLRVGVMSLETGELQVLEEDAMWARYVTTGHVVFVRSDGSVMGAPFDLERLEFTSPPVPVFEINFPFASGFAVELAIADNGTVAYIPPGGSDRTLVLVDRVGNETELVPARLPYESPKFSPDGRSLAVAIVAGPARDLWTLDLDAGTRSRLTFGNDNFYPVWTPDGQQIAFASRRTGGADIYVN